MIAAIGKEIAEQTTAEEPEPYPPELLDVLGTIPDIYEGVDVATEKDRRGRSRETVRQYADREYLGSDQDGRVLRVREVHGLVVKDGNRWRVTESGSD